MPDNLYRRGDTYYARFFVAGQLQRVSLRTSDLREAKARLKGIRTKAERHAYGIQNAKTWNEAVAAYAAGVLDAGGVKDSTAKRYRVSLRQIHDAFQGKPLPTITPEEISAYIDARQKAGTSNATIRRDLTTISRVLAYAKAKGMVATNAADDYDRRLLREIRPGIHIPAEEAVKAAQAAAEAAGAPQLAQMIRFLRTTGMRAGEALRARWEHLHGDDLLIPETKNGRVRTIDVAAADLPPRKKTGRLFPDLPEDSGALASRWQWIRREMPKAQHFRIHDLRHAYAVDEMRRGRDIYDLSHHLGHSSVKVTEIYLGYVAGGRAKSRRQVTQNLTQRPSEGGTKTAKDREISD